MAPGADGENRGPRIQVLIPPDASKRKGAPAWLASRLYAFMRPMLATDHGKALFRKRHATVEPVFGQMKFNRRFDRFLRGKSGSQVGVAAVRWLCSFSTLWLAPNRRRRDLNRRTRQATFALRDRIVARHSGRQDSTSLFWTATDEGSTPLASDD